MGIVRRQGGDRREVTSGGNSHELRVDRHEMRQVLRPNRLLALRPSPRREALAAPWRAAGVTKRCPYWCAAEFDEQKRFGTTPQWPGACADSTARFRPRWKETGALLIHFGQRRAAELRCAVPLHVNDVNDGLCYGPGRRRRHPRCHRP